jgi:hypothetical protein
MTSYVTGNLIITPSTKLIIHYTVSHVFSLLTALPHFVLSLRRETVRRGEMATFLCEAEGDMPMQIIWLHNGIQISHEFSKR